MSVELGSGRDPLLAFRGRSRHQEMSAEILGRMIYAGCIGALETGIGEVDRPGQTVFRWQIRAGRSRNDVDCRAALHAIPTGTAFLVTVFAAMVLDMTGQQIDAAGRERRANQQKDNSKSSRLNPRGLAENLDEYLSVTLDHIGYTSAARDGFATARRPFIALMYPSYPYLASPTGRYHPICCTITSYTIDFDQRRRPDLWTLAQPAEAKLSTCWPDKNRRRQAMRRQGITIETRSTEIIASGATNDSSQR